MRPQLAAAWEYPGPACGSASADSHMRLVMPAAAALVLPAEALRDPERFALLDDTALRAIERSTSQVGCAAVRCCSRRRLRAGAAALQQVRCRCRRRGAKPHL